MRGSWWNTSRRLELASIALKCLQERELRDMHAGDRSYALMGLFRIRPQIDGTDSAFQAFARCAACFDLQ
jgi:hypothetical protein